KSRFPDKQTGKLPAQVELIAKICERAHKCNHLCINTLLGEELARCQLAVELRGFQQLCVSAASLDLALIDDQNLIRIRHRGQPVRHDDDGLICTCCGECIQDKLLVL